MSAGGAEAGGNIESGDDVVPTVERSVISGCHRRRGMGKSMSQWSRFV